MAHPDPEFSILALGRQLGAMHEREHLLDVLATSRGTEHLGAPLDAHRLAQRHAEQARVAIEGQCEALEDLILASRPDTLADALLLVMVAHSRVNVVAHACDREAAGREQDRVEAALSGALRVIAREAGIPLADVGGEFYAPTWRDPWPDVDVSGVGPDPRCQVDRCTDGSAPTFVVGKAAA